MVQQEYMGEFYVGDEVIFEGNTYRVVQQLGRIFIMGQDGDATMTYHYKIEPINGGDVTEVLEGDLQLADTNVIMSAGAKRKIRKIRRKTCRKTKSKRSFRRRH